MTDQEKTKVISKIQKLFNLAENNPSEEEAASALKQARVLLIKYNLSEDEIDAVESSTSGSLEGGDSVVVLKTGRIHSWVHGLVNVVCAYFNVKCYHQKSTKSRITFYGVKINSEAAGYAFQSIFSQVQALAKKYKPSKKDFEFQGYYTDFSIYSVKARFEYREGVISGLMKSVNEIKQNEEEEFEAEKITALAVRSEDVARDWLAAQGLNIKSVTNYSKSGLTNSDGYTKGREDSSKVHITGKGLGE